MPFLYLMKYPSDLIHIMISQPTLLCGVYNTESTDNILTTIMCPIGVTATATCTMKIQLSIFSRTNGTCSCRDVTENLLIHIE
jgi:hypothetical protein